MNLFDSVPSFSPNRSKHLITQDFIGDVFTGAVTPIDWYEVVPGDNLKQSMALNVKSFPMVSSPFGQVNVDVNTFYVSYRDLDPNFADRLTGGETGKIAYQRSIDMTDNLCACKSPTKYSLKDYLGYPMLNTSLGEVAGTKDAVGTYLSVYPILAYNHIWNEYYRNENTMKDATGNPIKEHCRVGDGLPYLCRYQNTNKEFGPIDKGGIKWSYLEKDYFTSALSERQKGVPPALTVSGYAPILVGGTVRDSNNNVINPLSPFYDNLGNKVTVRFDNSTGLSNFSDIRGVNYPSSGVTGSYPSDTVSSAVIKDTKVTTNFIASHPYDYMTVQPCADLSSSVGFSIDEWRTAMALQRYLERTNICGSRYEEYLLSMFSCAPSNDSLNKPVWIGGFRLPIVFSEVTSSVETTTKSQGTVTGKAWSEGSDYIGDYFVKEYGIVMTCLTIRPKVLYSQGCDRALIKPTKLDYYNPLFKNLSEQEVYAMELFEKSVDNNYSAELGLKNIVGFNPRYSELYCGRDKVVGSFRDSLSTWCFSRAFADTVSLNKETHLCKAPEYADKWTVTNVPQWYVECKSIRDMVRPIDNYPMPM